MSNIESAAETMHRRQQQDLIELHAEVERLRASIAQLQATIDLAAKQARAALEKKA